jgi:hypothetical protein
MLWDVTRVSLIISMAIVADNAVATDIEAVGPPLWLRRVGRLTTTGDATQKACFGFHGTDGVRATSPRGCTLEARQHTPADGPMVADLWLFSGTPARAWSRRERLWRDTAKTRGRMRAKWRERRKAVVRRGREWRLRIVLSA